MADISLKYLHPSLKSYITTENYTYDTSTESDILFAADVFEHGKDNVIQTVNTLSEYLFKYGDPNFTKYGQQGYNIETWLTNGGTAKIMRLLPDNAQYAHAVFNIQYKNSTNGKTVLNDEGEETKIDDVYLRPVVCYIGINNTSEELLESELSEDRTDYPTTDGYYDNFLFIVYPEGRGEYYNDYGFRIRLNNSYDQTMTSRVYTFEVIQYSDSSTYQIVDGPFYVSFDPDALDPNSQRSMFIEDVVNSNSNYVKVKFSTENYLKLANTINNEVDPYIIDVLTGQSRILSTGTETFLCDATRKDEDVHIALHSYSSNGTVLTNNGEIVLNIANNDEDSSDIVDIADNARVVIYNNQKYLTDYMRTYYNWLVKERTIINLNKILSGNIESNIDEINGLLKEKVDNLVFNNILNSDSYSYIYNSVSHTSSNVGKSGQSDAWYLITQETIDPSRDDAFVTDANGDSITNSKGISTSEMQKTITTDGYNEESNKHLISYYNSFMRYFQYVANYDLTNAETFVTHTEVKKLIQDIYTNYADYSLSATDFVYRKVNLNGYTSSYALLANGETIEDSTDLLAGIDYLYVYTDKTYDSIINTSVTYIKANNGINSIVSTDGGYSSKKAYKYYLGYYYDENCGYYRPVIDYTLYNSSGEIDPCGKYVYVVNYLNEKVLINVSSIQFLIYNTAAYPNNTISSASTDSLTKTSVNNVINVFDITDGLHAYNPITVSFSNLSSASIFGTSSSSYLVLYNINDTTGDHTILLSTARYGIKVNANYNTKIWKIEDYNTKSKAVPSWIAVIDLLREIQEYDYILDNWKLAIVTNEIADSSTIYISKYSDLLKKVSNKDYLIVNGGLEIFIKNRAESINNYSTTLESSSETGIKLGNLYYEDGGLVLFNSLYTQCYIDVYDSDNGKFTNISATTTDDEGNTITTITASTSYIQMNVLSTDKYISADTDYSGFDESFDTYAASNKLTLANNKVSSYASLISKELDSKGKIDINDLDSISLSSIDYTDFSLTTIINFILAGFEADVNNMGTITDYSNYASLKYLLSTINDKIDLRSTYLTLLSIHKNNVADLSTELAKNNVSVILGDETLNTLYTTMSATVDEANYLLTNIINTLLNTTYTIQDLETMETAEGDYYTSYFPQQDSQGTTYKKYTVDPLGINNLLRYVGTNNDVSFHGISYLLEKILIDITGENHYGDERTTPNGQCLYDIYQDIIDGYTIDGLTQAVYEDIYTRLTEHLENLSNIHNIIASFINEKYITEIMDALIGTIDIYNSEIKYNGKTFSVDSFYEYYYSGEDEDLTLTTVLSLVNDVIDVTNDIDLPYEIDASVPIIQYPYFVMTDIKDSITVASDNLDIVKSNIQKQDHVLATLNTLCYDNLVQDTTSIIGFAEGSDGDFTYDDSSTAAIKLRENKINDIRIKAYKGTWNDDVLNKEWYEFDYVFDACYEDSVKNAIVTLARDEREDFFFFADCKNQYNCQDTLDWKESFTTTTYFMSITSQSQTWYDEYTSKNIELTSAYLMAKMLKNHIDTYGIQYPMAGSRRGVVEGFISNSWYPNEDQKEELYTNKINYIERDPSVIRIGAQNTNYTSGPLGSINNMLVVLKIKRKVEKIAKTYQFEFNTASTRSSMASEINNYLNDWITNGACTVATASVYASDYDIMQKIARVDIELQFTGVIERIVINIDCPAS